MKFLIVALLSFAAFASGLPRPTTEMEWKAVYGSYPYDVIRESGLPLIVAPEYENIQILREPVKGNEIIVPVLAKESEKILEASKKPELENFEYVLPETGLVRAYADPEEFYRTFDFYPAY